MSELHVFSSKEDRLKRKSLKVENFKVTNIVVKMNAGKGVDYNKMLQENPSKFSYEPELFPGIHYRIDERTVATIFHTGRIYITGFKSIERAEEECLKLQMLLDLYKNNKKAVRVKKDRKKCRVKTSVDG